MSFWRIATSDPSRPAIIDGGGATITYGDLLTESRRLGSRLAALGLRRGDGVAVLAGNEPAFFTALLPGLEQGLYVTPINSHLVAGEVAHVLRNSNAAVLITTPALADVASRAADTIGYPADRRFVVGHADGFRPLDELGAEDATPARSPGAPMMFTSGTTGEPKGVRRPLPDGDPDDVFGRAATLTCQGFGVPVGTGAHLACGPLYHAGPYVGATAALHAGITIVLLDRWTPTAFLRAVEQHRITCTQMVPTMFHRLLALPEAERSRYDLSSLVSIFHTGAPCPVQTKQRMMDWLGPIVYETYGGTEGAATIATPKRWLERPGTVGRPINGVTVRILDAHGAEVPRGTAGDIWIDTGTAPAEYFNDEEGSRRIRRGRSVTLGDVGYLDDDGFLFLCDRKKDMIISGGVNIFPAEVEAALLADRRVADAAVIGVPDEEWGESVKAVVELAEGEAASADTATSLIDACKERIAAYKCPRSIDFVEAMPRLPNGKVEKRRLRDAFWATTGRSI
jgi:long-chain acyl-CoA synthetase